MGIVAFGNKASISKSHWKRRQVGGANGRVRYFIRGAVVTVSLTRLVSLGESARVFPRDVRGPVETHRVTTGPRMISPKPEISARRRGYAKSHEI